MAYSEASKRASMKYIKANYERIYVSLPKGYKEVWKEAAEKAGESLTSFIVKSVEMRLGLTEKDTLESEAL